MKRPLQTLTLTLTLLVPLPAHAQATRVDPTINERFRNPSVGDLEALLESEDRNVYRAREAIVAALGLEPGDDVADVGAGTGFLTRMIARKVAPYGRVYAVEITRELVNHVVTKSREEGLDNVVGVVGDDDTTHLPTEAVDLALVCYVYHHFENPEASLASIKNALRADGRLVVIDRERIRGITDEERYQHHLRAGKGTFTDEILDAGFELEKELPPLAEETYILFFKKRGH